MRKFGLGSLAALLVVALIASIGIGSGASAQDTSSAAFKTQIKFINAFTGLDAIDVYIEGERVYEELKYGESTDWFAVEPGQVRISFKREKNLSFDWLIYDVIYPVPAGSSYQVIITDVFVIPSVTDVQPVTEGSARVRITHGSVDTPAVDLYVGDNASPAISGLAYGVASEYVEVAAGTFNLKVTLAGGQDVALDVQGMVIEAGYVYDLVLAGGVGSTDHPIMVVTSASPVETFAADAVASPMATPAG